MGRVRRAGAAATSEHGADQRHRRHEAHRPRLPHPPIGPGAEGKISRPRCVSAFVVLAKAHTTTTIIPTPLGRRVKVVEQGTGTPVVFLHSGVGSAGEFKQIFSLWPAGYRLVAIDAYRDGTGPGPAQHRTLDDYADQVYAVVEHVRSPVSLVGFSWGGATALRVAAATPQLVDSLTLIEPEAYAMLRTEDPDAYRQICELRDRWRAHVRQGRWYEAFEEFVDFYNGPGAFARWPPPRREAFLVEQRARGDLWDVLFDDDLLAVDALADVTAPIHVVKGSLTSAVDQAICDVVRRHIPHARQTVIDGAGHMMPLTHPEPLTRAVLSGLDRGLS
jgi:lipase